MGDIGNGDQHDVAARIAFVVIQPGPYRIVMIARIGRIDGDQRNGAQVGPAARIDRLCRLGVLDHRSGKFGCNAMVVNGDQADGSGRIHAAYALDDFYAAETGDPARLGLCRHQFIVLGAA